MVVAKQVKRAVDHEADQLFPRRHSCFLGLTTSFGCTDVDVADETSVRRRKCEGDDVGGSIVAEMSAVEPAHPRRAEKSH